MKSLNLLLFLFLVVSCSENSKPVITNLQKTQPNKEQVNRTTPKEIFFDSFAYDFIEQISPIGENSILREGMTEFDKRFIIFSNENNYNLLSNDTVETPYFEFGVGSVATFEKSDSAFVEEQLKEAENKNWAIQRLQDPNLLNKYEVWVEQNQNFDWGNFKATGFGCFVTLSVPIFNKKKNKAVIVIGNLCHQTLGVGYVHLFELKNKKWIAIKNRQLWIS